MSLIGKTTDIYNFKKVIDDIVDTNLINKGITKYISAKVIGINSNNTVNVYIPPDTTNVINGLANKTGEFLYTGDSVELCAKNGSVKNSWVAVKHGIGTVGGGTSSDYDSLPVGSVITFPGNKAPDGYLFCMGQEVSRTERSDLFALIGTTYGEGDGVTTFNLPNLCGKIPVGLDISDISFNSLGKTGGEKTHTLTIDEMPNHTHKVNYVKSNITPLSDPGISGYNGNNEGLGDTRVEYTGGNQAHNNLQPYITLNYIIKASRTAVLKGNVVDSLDGDSISNAPSIHAVNEGLLQKYSTNETIIGRWVDNKYVYRKCIHIPSYPNNTTINIPINIEDLDYIIHIYGVANKNGDGHPINGSRIDIPNYTISCYINSGMLVISSGVDRSSYSGYVIIEYTKTTD